MPMIDLTVPEGALDEAATGELVDALTTALLKAERAPHDNEFFRSITWAFVHGTPVVYQGGQRIEQPLVRLQVTTPQGALSQRRRAELVTGATQIICNAVGIASDRVWVICQEIDEGSWGAFGEVVEFQKLREAAAKVRDEAATV